MTFFEICKILSNSTKRFLHFSYTFTLILLVTMILNSFFQVCKSSVNLLTSMFVEIDLKFCFGVYSTGSEPSALG